MRKRNCRFEVCFTKDELSDLTKKARKARLSNGAFVRSDSKSHRRPDEKRDTETAPIHRLNRFEKEAK